MSKTDLQPVYDFQSVVVGASHQTPVVALFTAPSCAPCKLLKPVLTGLAFLYQFPLVTFDAAAQRGLANGLMVRSVPTVLVYSKGKEITRFTGVKDRDAVMLALAKAGVFQQTV